MKILVVEEEYYDIYGDWLKGPIAREFIRGNYTHIICEGGLHKMEVVSADLVDPLVSVGEGVIL